LRLCSGVVALGGMCETCTAGSGAVTTELGMGMHGDGNECCAWRSNATRVQLRQQCAEDRRVPCEGYQPGQGARVRWMCGGCVADISDTFPTLGAAGHAIAWCGECEGTAHLGDAIDGPHAPACRARHLRLVHSLVHVLPLHATTEVHPLHLHQVLGWKHTHGAMDRESARGRSLDRNLGPTKGRHSPPPPLTPTHTPTVINQIGGTAPKA